MPGVAHDRIASEERGIMSASLPEAKAKRQELTLFLLLTVVLAPVLSVAIIGSYGLFIWLSQIIGGPPTH